MSQTPAKGLLQGRVILITGAGSGLGRACALGCAAEGAKVILLGRTQQKLEAVYDEIVAKRLPEPALAPLDLAGVTDEDLAPLAASIQQRHGRLDGLLHNAAILGDRVPFEHGDAAQWQTVMQVNFHAPVLLTRRLLPLLLASPDGRLVFTTSAVGAKPSAYWGAYAVSKHALEGFAMLLADELEKTAPLRINTIDPGATRTALRAAAYPAEQPSALKPPEALLPLYLHLLGPDSQGDHGKLFTESWLATHPRRPAPCASTS